MRVNHGDFDMPNDNRKEPRDRDSRNQAEPAKDSYPGNPNRQEQDAPRQQQGESGGRKQPDSSRLHDSDRSVTDRTVRKSVIDHGEDDDGDIDRLKG